MPTTHTVRTREAVEVTFACSLCDFSARAVVEGQGVGTATSFIVIDRKHARENAAVEAIAEAKHDAQVIASIAPCPRCHKRSPGAVTAYVVKSALAVSLLLAVGVVTFLITSGWVHYVVPAAIAVAAVAAARRRRTRYLLASAMLENVRPEVVLPRAQVRALPPAPAPQPALPPVKPAKIEPTPAGDEPRTLR